MKRSKVITVFPVREEGLRIAERFSEGIGNIVIHKPAKLRRGGLRKEVSIAFKGSSALVFVSAVGIAVRSIARFLKGKDRDPAVIVMDEKGRFVVSLLSGHLGGANKLAEKISRAIGATPVITTASDIAGLLCVEEIAGRFALAIEDVRKIKKINSSILDNTGVCIIDEDRKRLKAIEDAYGAYRIFSFRSSFPEEKKRFRAFIFISPFIGRVPERFKRNSLILRPREFIAGVGCGRGVGVKELARALNGTLKKARVSPLSIKKLATIDIKKNEHGLIRLADKMNVEIDFFNAGDLSKKTGKPSKMVLKYTGAGGVAEPAALLSSGAKRIWSKKKILGKVTIALARERFTP